MGCLRAGAGILMSGHAVFPTGESVRGQGLASRAAAPRRDITRRRRGPSQPLRSRSLILGHVRDKDGAKCLARRMLHVPTRLVAAL